MSDEREEYSEIFEEFRNLVGKSKVKANSLGPGERAVIAKMAAQKTNAAIAKNFYKVNKELESEISAEKDDLKLATLSSKLKRKISVAEERRQKKRKFNVYVEEENRLLGEELSDPEFSDRCCVITVRNERCEYENDPATAGIIGLFDKRTGKEFPICKYHHDRFIDDPELIHQQHTKINYCIALYRDSVPEEAPAPVVRRPVPVIVARRRAPAQPIAQNPAPVIEAHRPAPIIEAQKPAPALPQHKPDALVPTSHAKVINDDGGSDHFMDLEENVVNDGPDHFQDLEENAAVSDDTYDSDDMDVDEKPAQPQASEESEENTDDQVDALLRGSSV